jgi:hypothetical protein
MSRLSDFAANREFGLSLTLRELGGRYERSLTRVDLVAAAKRTSIVVI